MDSSATFLQQTAYYQEILYQILSILDFMSSKLMQWCGTEQEWHQVMSDLRFWKMIEVFNKYKLKNENMKFDVFSANYTVNHHHHQSLF